MTLYIDDIVLTVSQLKYSLVLIIEYIYQYSLISDYWINIFFKKSQLVLMNLAKEEQHDLGQVMKFNATGGKTG